ncbi:MAG: motility associated factor glycosyltransferase family protein [Succinivibrio sp.]|nr:motility associated factor glycosyltransferase family protein [Succinivibrio sp.]
MHDPALFERFAHYVPRDSLDLLPTADGAVNLRFARNGKWLYDAESPLSFSDEWITKQLSESGLTFPPFDRSADPIGQIQYRYQLECMDLIDRSALVPLKAAEVNLLPNLVMVGSGLGYPLAALYSKKEVLNVVLVEPDPDVFFASLHCFDWASLLTFLHHNGSALKVVVASEPAQICALLQTHYVEQGVFLAFAHCFVLGDGRDEIPKLRSDLEHEYHSLHTQMGFFDDNLFGLSHGLSAINHHARFVRLKSTAPASLAGIPVYIVGNGPSLDRDLPFIRKTQDQAMIIACGTALDTLFHAGIQPDFYACTERIPQIAQTLKYLPKQGFLSEITLLAAEVVHPDTLRLFKHSALFVKNSEVLRWLLKELPFQPINHMNPVVGNMGLAAALTLGFDNLFLFGMDLGRKQGTSAHHSRGSEFYYGHAGTTESIERYLKQFPYQNVRPGNFGGLCECSDIFVLALFTMAAALRERAGAINCHNCSDGVRIDGALPLHSEDIEVGPWPVLDKKTVRFTLERELTFEITLDEKELTRRCDHQSFSELCIGLQKMWQMRPVDRLSCIRVMQRSCALLNHLDLGGYEFMNQLLRGSAEFYFMLILRALYVCPDEQKCMALTYRLISLFEHFLTDACAIYRFVPHYEMGAHQQLCGGRVGADYPDSKAPAMPQLVRLVAENYEDPQRHFVKRYE